MRVKKLLLLSLFLLYSLCKGVAQEKLVISVIGMDTSVYSGIDTNDVTKYEKQCKPSEKELNFKFRYDLSWIKFQPFKRFDKDWGFILKIFFYCVIIILIGILIYFITKEIRDSQIKSGKKVSIDENFEIENIEDLEISGMLSQALEDGNYRFAIRLQFLELLKRLQTKKLINWKKNKTNRNYIKEIKPEYAEEFRQLVHIFDGVWYGNIPIDKTEYEYIVPRFQSFMSQNFVHG